MAMAFYSSFSLETVEDDFEIPTYTAVDSVYGELMILRLKENWPFKKMGNSIDPIDNLKPTSVAEVLALGIINQQVSWLEANARLFDEYKKKNDLNMIRAATVLAQEFRNLDEPLAMLAEANLIVGDTVRALEIVKPKFEKENKEVFGQLLANIYLDKRDFSQALSIYKKLTIINPNSNDFKLRVSALEEIQGSFNEMNTYLNSNRTELVGFLGAYLYLGLVEEAKQWFNFIQKNFPGEDLKQFELLINSNPK